MNKHFKFLVIPLFVLSFVSCISSMEMNTINTSNSVNQNTINNTNQNLININQNNININQQSNNDKFFTYDPYSIHSSIPTDEDLIQFMKVKELDFADERIQQCFKNLQKYDPYNGVLLYRLLESIYCTTYYISRSNIINIRSLSDSQFCSFCLPGPNILSRCAEARYNYYQNACDLEEYKNITNIELFDETKEFMLLGLKLEKQTNCSNPTVQFPDIKGTFHQFRSKLNPEKYNYIPCNKTIKNINNLTRFCYSISNLLVCLSHDIVYAVKKESDKYKTSDNKEEIKQNIYNIITYSFNNIMNMLMPLKSGMFFNELLWIDEKYYTIFQRNFESIKKFIINMANKFSIILNTFKRDNQNMAKVNKLMDEIMDEIKNL